MCVRSNKWRIALLFLSATAAFGLPQKAGLLASVSGRVTNSATGAPVPHAHIAMYGDRQKYGALTNIDGKFSIAQLPDGSYNIAVDAPGFQSPPVFYDMPVNRLVLRPGEHKNDLDIALTPFAAISGQVTDAEGRPLQGMTISVLSIEGVTDGGVSDPDGQYRVGNLPPGRYRVQAAPGTAGNLAPEIRSDGTTEVHYSPTYYPSSLTIDSAGRLELPPGTERTGVDIRMILTPIVAVRGKVFGIPATKAEFSIAVRKVELPLVGGKSIGRMFVDQRRVNPDGSFVIWRLDPGSYFLTAQSYREGWASPPVEITVADKDLDDVALHLIPLSSISGQILRDDEWARLPPIPANASLAETPQISLEGQRGYSHIYSVIAADGSYQLDRVWPDQYSVRIGWGDAYPFVKSMQLGAKTIEGSTLDLRNGSQGASLTVTIGPARGQIRGVVRGSEGPAAYARVALLSKCDAIRSDPYVLSARSDGTYTFINIAPGEYRLMALDAGVAHARALCMHLEDYADIIKTVVIHPDESLTLDLHRH